MRNQEIAKIFKEMAIYLEMENVPFKPQAYERAAATIELLSEDLEEIYKKNNLKGLISIPGIGAGIAQKITEYLETNTIKEYEKLKNKIPVDLSNLITVEGLGPKGIKKLYKYLDIKNIQELEKAALEHKICQVEGFGEKSEAKILQSIKFLKHSSGRFILGFITPTIRELENRLHKLPDVKKIITAGSVRRRKETIGDIDILITIKEQKNNFPKIAKKIIDYFISMPEVMQVLAQGETKSSIKLKEGLNVDLRIVSQSSYGAALNYFTGSKEHNIALRELALQKGYKLNEYGLFKNNKKIAGSTEEEIYQILGLEYIEPELRENTGEIEAAQKKNLPKLINYKDLQGDLQIQTTWTDGENSIEEMAQAAIQAGLKYIAITDHTKRLAMTRGLDEKKIIQQWKEIDRLNKKYAGRLKILKGSECDILKDGALDLPDSILAKLDICGASIHSFFNLSKKEQTERLKRAMRNPHVDIIFHPTGRIINKREAYSLDIDEIIKTAKETGTILEIDAYPNRLDLKDEYIRKCIQQKVKLSIDSDAHSKNHLQYLEYGIAQARRGWAEKKDIINCWPLEKMLKLLKK